MINNNNEPLNLSQQLALGSEAEKQQAFLTIKELAQNNQIFPASINNLYLQRAQGKIQSDFTVPAINIKGLTFAMARAIFKTALKNKIGAFIFELARSEISYTQQSPQEYVGLILAAAVAEKFVGPVFIQGDHFQFKPQPDLSNYQTELQTIKELSLKAIEAGFYNLDIDASTLVDYSQALVSDQQKNNFEATAKLVNFIRQHQPANLEISLGGEIGHIGGKNSTAEELQEFMLGFKQNLNPGLTGLSKISIQTGTQHGGTVLADGSLQAESLDFNTLATLSMLAQEYGMGGAVQHGASTLPEQCFSQFPQVKTLEIHLATEFQNIIFDHPDFPSELKTEMYRWLDTNKADRKQPSQTQAQFYYKNRKYVWAPFKAQLCNLSDEIKTSLMQTIEEKLELLFQQLNVMNTQELVKNSIVSI